MKLRILSVATLSLCGFILAGCPLKDMKEMKETTKDMKNTTSALSEKTTRMGETTNQLNAKAAKTLSVIEKGSIQARNEALNLLKDADSQAAMLAAAGKYMKAMEMQFWEPQFQDVEFRQILFKQALKEFFFTLKDLIDDNHDNVYVIPDSLSEKVGAFFDTKKHKKQEMLFAIAAELHETLEDQTRALKGTSYSSVSILDLLVEGINANRESIETGKSARSYPEYIQEVMVNFEDVLTVLRVRQNFLNAYAYSLMSQKDGGDNLGIFENLKLIKNAAKKGKSWTPVHVGGRNNAQLLRLNAVFERALFTTRSMVCAKIDPKTEPKMIEVLQMADLSGLKRFYSKSANENEKEVVIENLRLINNLKETVNPTPLE